MHGQKENEIKERMEIEMGVLYTTAATAATVIKRL